MRVNEERKTKWKGKLRPHEAALTKSRKQQSFTHEARVFFVTSKERKKELIAAGSHTGSLTIIGDS